MADNPAARRNSGIPLAVSACLAGEPVRFDATSAESEWPRSALTNTFRLIPVCPEVGIGMPVPRPPIHLVRADDSDVVRLVEVAAPHKEYTGPMTAYAEHQARYLTDAGVAGYVFMPRSPSCGLVRVKTRALAGAASPVRDGQGVFAARLQALLPWLPVMDANTLFDARVQREFVARARALDHWQRMHARGPRAGELVSFAASYKYLIMSRSTVLYGEAGRAVADLRGSVINASVRYRDILMQALALPPTRKGHVNALRHVQGYFRRQLRNEHYNALTAAIDAFARGESTYGDVLQQVSAALGTHADPYLKQQVYLEDPQELARGLTPAGFADGKG